MSVNQADDAEMIDSLNVSSSSSPAGYTAIMTTKKLETEVVDVVETATSNPAIARVQSALKSQLAKTRDRIQLQFQEEQDEFLKAKKDREDCGVELYGMQQQLAQLQKKSDDSGDQHASLMKSREHSEEEFKELQNEIKTRNSKKSKLKKQSSKRQEELDEEDSRLKQAKQFNEETKNEVAVTKRAASKAEEVVKGSEKGKEAQDIYIDGLNQEMKHLSSETKWAAKRLEIQKNQTGETDTIIKDLTKELDALAAEKKQLVQQWNSAILALGRRDQGLGAVISAAKEARDNAKDNTSELIGLNRESFNLSLEMENNLFGRNKIENEINLLEQSIAKAKSDQETLASQQELITKIVTKTQENDEEEERKAKRHSSEMTSVRLKIEVVSREIRDLEDQIGTYREEQTSISQAAINVMKQERVLSSKIYEKDIEAGIIDNDLARVKIDLLNTTVHCSQLKDKFHSENQIIEDKNQLIASAESTIKRSHNDIDSKMNKVDRLNRKYEQMLYNVDEEEPSGPLEATIKGIEKELIEMDEVARNLQTEWVSHQTKLIHTINATEKLEVEKKQKAATLTILKQKRLRLLQEIHTNEATLKVIESRIKGMHTDMSRLNELTGKYTQLRTKLANDNAVRQMEFAEEMTELRRKAVEIEVKTSKAKMARDELLEKIMDAEKEILQWEKKLKLEKETQAALNSSEHAIEIKGMEKEIHRMRHGLEQMNRQQETMIREMEFAINKKEDIAVKYQNNRHGNGTSTANTTTTKAEARKRKGEMKRKLSFHKKETALLLSKQQEIKNEIEITNENLSSTKMQVERENGINKTIQTEINNLFFEKQRLLANSNYLQELMRKYQSLEDGDVLDHQKEQFSVQKRVAIMKTKTAKVQNAIAGLRIKHAQYDDIFDRMNTLVTDVIHKHNNI